MKSIIQWDYERASWQWDLLCIVILVFIFLTPKEWFEGRDRATPIATSTVKTQAAER